MNEKPETKTQEEKTPQSIPIEIWGPYCKWSEDIAIAGAIPEFLLVTPEIAERRRQQWLSRSCKPDPRTVQDDLERIRKSQRIARERARQAEKIKAIGLVAKIRARQKRGK